MLIRRIARPMLAATFITRGVDTLRSPKLAAQATQPTLDELSKLPDPVASNVPSDAETVAKVTAGVQIGAGLLLAAGRLPRVSSAALALSVVPSSLGAHAFWNEADAERKASERRAFLADVSLVGGLIIAAVDLEGRPSLGWRGRRAARKLSDSVSNALPSGSGNALIDAELVDRIGDGLQSGLHVGAERGREFAHVARERGSEWADVARDRAPEIAEKAQKRGSKLVDLARDRGPDLADAAQKRGSHLVDVARDRGSEWADVASKRGSELADVASKRGSEWADIAQKHSSEWADVARDRGSEWADLAYDRGADLAKATRKEAKRARKEVKKARKQAEKRLR